MNSGWHPDPSGEPQLRYWDGERWTEHVRPDVHAWVTGPRVIDVPGVFAYGRKPGERTSDDDTRIDRRLLRQSLIALAVAAIGFIPLRAFYGWAVINELFDNRPGLPEWLLRLLFYVPFLVLFSFLGRWHVVLIRLWRRLHQWVSAPPPPPDEPGPVDLWPELRAPELAPAAARLDEDVRHGTMNDVDFVRVARALQTTDGDRRRLATVAELIADAGSSAFLHPSGQRDLPARVAQHDLVTGQVRVGTSPTTQRNPFVHRGRWFAVDPEVLRTSMLIVGPPGAGKTRSLARPVVEMLCLQALGNMASVVVIDPKGTDFRLPGFFDVEIDLTDPEHSWGFDLFGGAHSLDQAADRLASALLPPGVSADRSYFMDSSRNALYQVIAPFHAATGGYPTIRQMIDLLVGEPTALADLTDRLHSGDLPPDVVADCERLLAAREHQRQRKDDPAGVLIERLGLLDRPGLARIFTAPPERRFSMRDIDRPLRVRIGLPESAFPEASRILARLAVAQFTQAATAPDANHDIFRGLVVDEAGRFIDEYVAQGLQRLRAANAGMMLLAHSLSDFPADLRGTVFASAGCKAVFAGSEPRDAEYFADYWGKNWVPETSVTRGYAETVSKSRLSLLGIHSAGSSTTHSMSVTTKAVERYVWSPSEIINDVPFGHALVSLATADGIRTGPVLVNLRG